MTESESILLMVTKKKKSHLLCSDKAFENYSK